MTEISNEQYAAVDQVIRQLVLAHADREISAIAVVFLNRNGEPEMELGIHHSGIYTIIASLDILKDTIKNMLIERGRMKPKNRE